MSTSRLSGRVVVCLAFLFFIAPMWARAADVVVVKSKELSVYEKAIAGFKQQYKGSLSILTMKGDLNDPGKLAARVKSESPKAILAVGLRAAKVLKGEITGIPIVFCMAMNPLQNKLRSSNTTGVDLEPRPREQLLAFKEALPAIKNVGIIYDPKRTGPFVDSVAKAASEAGVGLIAVRIKEKKDVPAALKQVIKKADALWLIRDATVMSREFFNHTLIVQFEKKIPLLAYSPMFVRKQAVCSFAASYSDQGRKAAEVVMMILGGTSPGDIPIQAPSGTLTINLNSAAKAGAQIPPSVLNKPGVEKVGK